MFEANLAPNYYEVRSTLSEIHKNLIQILHKEKLGDLDSKNNNLRKNNKRYILRTIRKNSLFTIGGLLLVILILLAIFGPLIINLDPVKPDLRARNQPPGWQGTDGIVHYLGTDHLGRDLASRLISGLRVSLLIGIVAMFGGAILGTFLGLISGYYGGNYDNLIMRLVDIQMSFPYILMAIVLAAFWGTGLWQIIVIVAIRGWVDYARVVRSSVLGIKTEPFVEASRALGATNFSILFRHVLPNTIIPAVIISTFQVGRAVVLESTLSFLGLGIAPPTPSLGGILNDGRSYLADAWWAVAGSGAILILLVLSINLLGDGLRDVLDPKLIRN